MIYLYVVLMDYESRFGHYIPPLMYTYTTAVIAKIEKII